MPRSWLVGVLWLAGCAGAPARDESDCFFDSPLILDLRLELPEREMAALREDPRAYVSATLREGAIVHRGVGVKLKGAVGSFQAVDERPAITVNVNKFVKEQTFHAMSRFHLNNSVQDPTCLHEQIASRLFAEAGMPAARVAHARVRLNGRDLGLYVLKEGFDSHFLARHFRVATGNFYDGGFVQDIDADLERDSGTGPEDRRDLKELVEACREPDRAARWRRIEAKLHVDAFITFMAVELMTGHWDGYSLNCNNYRVYVNPADGRAHFLPHGMDQVFQDPGASVLDHPRALVASAVMGRAAWRARFRQRVAELLPLFESGRLHPLIDGVSARLMAVMGSEQAAAYPDQVRDLKERLAARTESLREQLARPIPPATTFDESGMARLGEWQPWSESEDAVIEQDHSVFHVRAGASRHCVAGWSQRVVLPHGRYSLRGTARADGVLSIRDEWGAGAGFRTSLAGRTNRVAGTTRWRELVCVFEVAEESREIDLVIELRAVQGEAWFERRSVVLRRER